VAQDHNMNARQYWKKFGYDNKKVKNKKEAWSVS